jgi:hypothetical protein
MFGTSAFSARTEFSVTTGNGGASGKGISQHDDVGEVARDKQRILLPGVSSPA